MCAPQYPDDLAFRPSFRGLAHDSNQYAIPMHHLRRFRRRQKHIRFALALPRLRNEKAETVTMNRNASRYEIRFSTYRNEVARTHLDDEAFVDQAVQRVFECIAAFTLQPQLLHELLICRATVRQGTYMFEQIGVGEAGSSFDGTLLLRCCMLGHYRDYKNAGRIARIRLY